MSRKILGLDIRLSSATAVLMETGLKKSVISGFGHARFPEEGTYHERLTQTLKAISDEMDLKDSVCAMSVPSDHFFYRNLSVPFGEAKKIQQMLPYELEPEIPFPVEDLIIDFNKVPLQGHDEKTRIIAAGIETERLKGLLDAVESCGIVPQFLFPVGYTMATGLGSKVFPDDTFLFIDFDEGMCSLYLLLNGSVSLIRAVHLSQTHSKSAIHLWGHVQRSLAGFESLFETKVSPSAIIINGSPNTKFPKQLETVSTFPVETLQIELPDNCELPREAPETFSPAGSFNGALSCALSLLDGYKGMNFRKGPFVTRNRFFEYRDHLTRTGIIAGIIFLLWLGGGIIGNFMTQRKVDRIDSQIRTVFQETFPDIHNIVEPVHQMRTQIEILKKAAYGSTDTTSQIRSVDLLLGISRNIPSNLDVIFSKLRLSDDGVYIEGTTATFNEVESIKTKLESIDDVVSVDPQSTSREGNRIRFKLRIETSSEEAS